VVLVNPYFPLPCQRPEGALAGRSRSSPPTGCFDFAAVAVKMGTAARAVDLEELQLEPEVAVCA
jgi:hypothetical protein